MRRRVASVAAFVLVSVGAALVSWVLLQIWQ